MSLARATSPASRRLPRRHEDGCAHSFFTGLDAF
jgi:hypothetical protein